jgi:hypothetical protein
MQRIHTQRRRIKNIAAVSPPGVVVCSYTGKSDAAFRMTEKGRIKTKRNKRDKYRNKKFNKKTKTIKNSKEKEGIQLRKE